MYRERSEGPKLSYFEQASGKKDRTSNNTEHI